MKYDMIVSGVGGQGILSISFVMDNAALEEGLSFKQSEVHGMAQRGGAVVSHLRIADKQIFSDLVPLGSADLVLSMEPLETLRYVQYMAPEGRIISSTSPFINIPNYPELDGVMARLQEFENHTLINSADIARAAGSHYAQNIVMLGTAADFLPVENKLMEKFITVLFKSKGEKVVDANIRAFRFGAIAGAFYRELKAVGVEPKAAIQIGGKMDPEHSDKAAIPGLKDLMAKKSSDIFINWLQEQRGLISFTADAVEKWNSLNLEKATPADFE